jgi:transposase-like protein
MRPVVAVGRRSDLSVAEVAVDFGVAEETVRRWMHQADTTTGSRTA